MKKQEQIKSIILGILKDNPMPMSEISKKPELADFTTDAIDMALMLLENDQKVTKDCGVFSIGIDFES